MRQPGASKAQYKRTQLSVMIELEYHNKGRDLLTAQETIDCLKENYVTPQAMNAMKTELLSMKLIEDKHLRIHIDNWEV